ncbi:MAG: bacteriohemerythrin [Peptococcaceae bacterium]|jgi:hemerythrin|nr:bacteriohemerythrin [Peptococcaceae bacterium]
MAIAWQESLATGIRDIDDQHKELFKRVNALLEACSGGKGKEGIPGLLAFLTDYVVTHFGAEEAYMERFAYPDAAAHKALHAEFTASIAAFSNDLARQGPNLNLTVTVNRLVVDWLIRHIGKMDKTLGAFLAGRF